MRRMRLPASIVAVVLLTAFSGDTVGYSRAVDVATPADIEGHYARWGGPKPPPLDHDGIEDVFVEKGSRVWYWYGGHWLKLTGSD